MQFQVPQFIDMEDKIFGPFTFKEFIYLAGGAGIVFVIYKLLPLYIAIFLILPVATLSLMLTFYRVNNRPFVVILEAAIKHTLQNKMFLWKQNAKKEIKKSIPETKKLPEDEARTSFTESKLKELSWGLDVMDMKKK